MHGLSRFYSTLATGVKVSGKYIYIYIGAGIHGLTYVHLNWRVELIRDFEY